MALSVQLQVFNFLSAKSFKDQSLVRFFAFDFSDSKAYPIIYAILLHSFTFYYCPSFGESITGRRLRNPRSFHSTIDRDDQRRGGAGLVECRASQGPEFLYQRSFC